VKSSEVLRSELAGQQLFSPLGLLLCKMARGTDLGWERNGGGANKKPTNGEKTGLITKRAKKGRAFLYGSGSQSEKRSRRENYGEHGIRRHKIKWKGRMERNGPCLKFKG